MNIALATHQNTYCFHKMNFLKCEISTPGYKVIATIDFAP
jgi:hypothetical protein